MRKNTQKVHFIRLSESELDKVIQNKRKGYFWGQIKEKWYLVSDGKVKEYQSKDSLISDAEKM